MKKFLAVLTVAGVMGVTSTAFADLNIKIDVDNTKYKPIAQAKTQTQRPPEPRNLPNGQRPPAPPSMNRSRDIKGQPPTPPMSRDMKGQRPPISGDKRPPRPRSDDRRPPNGQMPRSGDRRPPDFNGQRPQMPQR